MIAFASLFLGLVTGIVPVTVLVEGPVASIRIEIDGRAAGVIQKPPWTLPIDFGPELLPHELVARAFDSNGKDVGVARQTVNLPRPPAEVEVVLERDKDGRPVAARYSGSSLIALRPARAAVTFDQKPLPAGESGRVELPDYDFDAPHVLTVVLEYSSAVRSRADVVFGGGTTSVAQSELTAVAIRRRAPAASTASDLSGSLVRGGQPLPVVAVEEGPALVCFVRGPTVTVALSALGTGGRTIMGNLGGVPAFDRDASRTAMSLGKADRLRFIWPISRAPGASPGAQLFDRSHDFSGGDAGIHWLLTRVEHPGPYPPAERLADAAAVAGLEATASGSRRAVVLILGDEASDVSRYAPSAVRRYLDTIHVPLFVWSLRSAAAQPLAREWGAVEDTSTIKALARAVDRLKAELASQRIVWIAGRYLPQEISVSESATGLELAK